MLASVNVGLLERERGGGGRGEGKSMCVYRMIILCLCCILTHLISPDDETSEILLRISKPLM